MDVILDFTNTDQIGLKNIQVDDVSIQVDGNDTKIYADEQHIATLEGYNDLVDDDLKALMYEVGVG